MLGMDTFFGGGVSKRQRRRQEIAMTKQAYAYGEETYSYLGTGREQAEERYRSRLGEMRARMAGGGARLGQSWETIQAELLRERNETLAQYAQEEKEFRASESYGIFRDDYEFMTKTKGTLGLMLPAVQRGDPSMYTVARPGKTGEDFFTSEQRSQLRTFSGTDTTQRELFSQYSERLTPSLQEWEKARFGGEQARAEFQETMDQRIIEANKWYDAQTKALSQRTMGFPTQHPFARMGTTPRRDTGPKTPHPFQRIRR